MIIRKEVFFLVCLINISVFSKILPPSQLKPKLIAQTTSGLVQGEYAGYTNGKNKTIIRFRGIPFAEPPIGNLRFEPPVPKQLWNGVMDTSVKAPICTQGSDRVTGSEDCLYVKIYTTHLPKRRYMMPVLVYLHGGGFYEGSPDFDRHHPMHLLDENIIVVSFHYRVGIFGFFSTNDEVAPGNVGLKDQLLALRWIKDNIINFGGNPARITLIGQSAGSASIGYLLGIPQARGLFSGAVMLSGNPLNQWALARDAASFVKGLAQQLGVNTSSSINILEGLKTIPQDTLQKNYHTLFQRGFLTSPLHGLPIGPVIEARHPDAIYSGDYHSQLENGAFADVPLIIGHTSLEAGPKEVNAIFKMLLPTYDLMPQRLVPISMNANDSRVAGRAIKEKYFGSNSITRSHYEFKKLISDDQFVRGILESIRLYSMKVSVYYYQFSYVGALSGETNRTFPGAGHSEDLPYLFETGKTGTQKDYLVRQRFVRMIANFATMGNPTPSNDPLLNFVQWRANDEFTPQLNCLDIDEDLKMLINPREEIFNFWVQLFKEHGQPPYSTF